jgi:hypothetical protein
MTGSRGMASGGTIKAEEDLDFPMHFSFPLFVDSRTKQSFLFFDFS